MVDITMCMLLMWCDDCLALWKCLIAIVWCIIRAHALCGHEHASHVAIVSVFVVRLFVYVVIIVWHFATKVSIFLLQFNHFFSHFLYLSMLSNYLLLSKVVSLSITSFSSIFVRFFLPYLVIFKCLWFIEVWRDCDSIMSNFQDRFADSFFFKKKRCVPVVCNLKHFCRMFLALLYFLL